jgi:hypothetical protein
MSTVRPKADVASCLDMSVLCHKQTSSVAAKNVFAEGDAPASTSG